MGGAHVKWVDYANYIILLITYYATFIFTRENGFVHEQA